MIIINYLNTMAWHRLDLFTSAAFLSSFCGRFSRELRALCRFNNTNLCNPPVQSANWWTVLSIPSDLLIPVSYAVLCADSLQPMESASLTLRQQELWPIYRCVRTESAKLPKQSKTKKKEKKIIWLTTWFAIWNITEKCLPVIYLYIYTIFCVQNIL